MSDSVTETPEVVVAPVESPIQIAAEKVNLRQLLDSLGKAGGLRILKEREIALHMPNGEAVVDMRVKELTKDQYDKLLVYTTRDMPEVPMISQHYTMARRDPVTGAIKPSGTYLEPNPSDTQYVAATQRWFNDSAVLFGLFAAAEEFGINLSLRGDELSFHLDDMVDKISKAFPTPTLLDIAYESALVNRGIPIAEQLIGAVEQSRMQTELPDFNEELP